MEHCSFHALGSCELLAGGNSKLVKLDVETVSRYRFAADATIRALEVEGWMPEKKLPASSVASRGSWGRNTMMVLRPAGSFKSSETDSRAPQIGLKVPRSYTDGYCDVCPMPHSLTIDPNPGYAATNSLHALLRRATMRDDQ